MHIFACDSATHIYIKTIVFPDVCEILFSAIFTVLITENVCSVRFFGS